MTGQGLILAVHLGRAAVLHDTDFGVVLYNFSSVLPFIDVGVPARLGWPAVSTRVIATDHRSICKHRNTDEIRTGSGGRREGGREGGEREGGREGGREREREREGERAVGPSVSTVSRSVCIQVRVSTHHPKVQC